jgi:site-specific recombinase
MSAALCRGMADGFRLLLARVQGQGLSLKLRTRSEPRPVAQSPFKRLADSGENLLCAWEQGRVSGPCSRPGRPTSPPAGTRCR